MINALRKKFITLATLTITFVVALVFIFINFLNYSNILSRNNEVITKMQNDPAIVLKLLVSGRDSGGKGVLSSDKYFYNSFIIATIDKDKNLLAIDYKNTRVEEDQSLHLVNRALSSNDEKGYIDHYKYGYVENDSIKYLVMIDCEKEMNIFFQFLKNSIIVAVIIIIISSLLLAVLARKVVRPIEENYKKQKQFITDASHELKTPLTIISSNADVLEMEVGDSKWLANIHNQIDRLTHLINSLVSFSRAEESDKILKNKFLISEVLKNRVDEFGELADFKGKNIVDNITSEISYFGEEQSIIQVIDILLDNAIKYADNNSTIDVNLQQVKKDIFLTVKNTAKGIEKGNLDKVFDRFYRLDESRNSKIKGYGIGLSLAKLIIDKHKGSIRAYAPEDNEFVIEIKLNNSQKIIID